MSRALLYAKSAALTYALLVASPGLAQDDFFTSSPGALSASHSSIDGQDNCNLCHDGGKPLSNDKCLDCHDHGDLKQRIRAGKGFHASAEVRGKSCGKCHLEHRGRKFDPMAWPTVGGRDDFDHSLSGWPLKEKHSVIDCQKCHKKKNRQGLRTYLGLRSECDSCHKEEQPHKFERGKMMDCDRCHTESAWTPAKRSLDFDHDSPKDAAMPLAGAHADVNCEKCHPKSTFKLGKKQPDSCDNCHETAHKGQLFDTKPCTWCHAPKHRKFTGISFAHKKRTGFALVGKHSRTKCDNCHTKGRGKRKPTQSCDDCHAKDDKHRGRFDDLLERGGCATCHSSSSWKRNQFNHNRNTKYDLTGKHSKIPCRKCHRGDSPAKFERLEINPKRCTECHAHENAHGGKFQDKKCLECHTQPGNRNLRKESLQTFHGPDSKFPLVKAHARIKCELCHKNDVYQSTPRECGVQCHEDSLHRGELGDECSRCHNAGQWNAVNFDHTEDTKWPLVGFHKNKALCADCHPAQKYKKTPKNCGAVGCHARDDAHDGRLGGTCDQCHRETGKNVFNHNKQAEFLIDGQHDKLRCTACHPSLRFKPRPQECAGCHAEPQVHKGQFGTDCASCHSTTSFAAIRAMHDVGAFSLTGAHQTQSCDSCHKQRRQLAGTGPLCITCHRADDIHGNALSPRCGECHTQWSFAPARFDHLTVGCNLMGLHRTMPCADCHQNGNYGALSAQCSGCHLPTAQAVTAPPHTGLIDCGSCHNPNSWSPGGPGVAGYGSQSICR